MEQLKFNQTTGKFQRDEPKKAKSGKRFSIGSNAGFLGWDVANVSLDSSIYANMTRMKARCRDLAKDNDYIRHALRLMQNNVVGDRGFRMQPMLKSLGGVKDKNFNSGLRNHWQRAGKLKNSPSVCGKLSRVDIAKLWLRTLMVDGEVILLLHPNYGNKYRFAIQFIDTALLDWQYNADLPNGHQIRMGVEVDSFGKPIAYHFLNHNPTEYLWGQHVGKGTHTRITADRICHDFLVEMPGQTRGVSLLASPAVRAHMLQKFEEAIVVGARVSASKVGFYRADENFDGIAPGDEGEDYELSQTHEPGTFEQLPRGLSLETFDPSSPPSNMEEFEKKLLKGIASGIGVDYVGMANDLEGVNYSSIRAGNIEQRSTYKGLQNYFIEHCEERVFERWAVIQTVNSDIDLNATKLNRLILDEAYHFLGRGWAWVDPAKEVKANREAIESKLTSHRRVVAETLGVDLEDLLEEISEDEKLMEDYGLTMISPNAPIPAPAPPVVEDEED